MSPNRQNEQSAFKEVVTETYKSLATLSLEGFRYLALINGGAIVALLTYVGSVTKSGGKQPDLGCAMYFFIGGLIACGAAMFCAYKTQLSIFNDLYKTNEIGESHKVWKRWGLAFYILSLGGFVLGSLAALSAFRTI